MSDTFEYESPAVDYETIAAVADEIKGGRVPPLSPEERAAHRLEHEQHQLRCQQADEQRRLDYEHKRMREVEAERAEADRQERIARSERQLKLQAEMRAQADRQLRDRQLSDLHSASVRAEAFRTAALRGHAHAHAQQLLESALEHLNPPAPPPEPTIVVVQEDDGSADLGSPNFDVAKWSKKPRSWWR